MEIMILPKESLTNTYLVYGIRHSSDLTSEYRYVGMTNNLASRARKHIWDANKGKNRYVCRWISSHLGNITFDILEICSSKEELVWCEMKWIHILESRGHRLTNHTKGGEGAFGRVLSEDTKARIAEGVRRSAANREWTIEQRLAVSERSRGRIHSEEARMKISVAGMGKSPSIETREKISKALSGRKVTHIAKGNHTRYHTNRGIINPNCAYC